jgi:hypothetical protein
MNQSSKLTGGCFDLWQKKHYLYPMNALVAQASAFWSKANAGITLLDIYLQGVDRIDIAGI